MADVDPGKRPLSPHLTIYRPQVTSISSIFIRITGNALVFSTLLLVAWFLAAAIGPKTFNVMHFIISSWFGKIMMILSLWALWYHSLGGIRHLVWDTGRGLELKTAEIMGWAMILGSFLLTIITLWLIKG
ncbi:MAG: succinate dehydrogenase, cytochrome b556 subunit [Planktomarina sp.]|jgi:succinate dehydrogenase / fumarate reductase cytochrome b subunit|nr:succinate dehydrogenase, cytochrome b556 subunit [Planktomarina sp.]|tara:strand:+ start:692 stop:1081 length:390 start_codon:yes stop_codon:yes gene_type:complete